MLSRHFADTPEDTQGDEQKIISMVYDFDLDSKEYHQPFFDHMVDAFGIYEGDKDAHYGKDPADGKSLYTKLQRAGKPALVKNVVFPLINLISGIQMDTRYTVTAVGRGGEDKALAEAETEKLRFVLDQSKLDRKASRQFFEGILCGRSWLACEEVYDERDMFATKTQIVNVDPGEIRYDRKSREYDLSDADYCSREKIVARGLAKMMWPKKAYELNHYFQWLDSQIDSKRLSEGHISSMQKDVVIHECYYRVHVMKKFLVDLETFHLADVSDVPNERAVDYLRSFEGRLDLITRPCQKMMFAQMVGTPAMGVLLDHGPSKYDDNYFPYIPYFAYRSRALDFGVVRNIIDPQRERNKRDSQILHYINEMPKTRLITTDQELANKFEQGEPIIVTKEGSKWQIVPLAAFPEALGRMVAQNDEDPKKISGISDDLRGVRHGQDAAATVNMRREQSLSAVNMLFDNHIWTMELLARVVMSRNRQFMSPMKSARILGPERLIKAPYLIEDMKQTGVEDYDVTIAMTPNSPSLRWENFQKIREMNKDYPGIIPPDIYAEAADVPQSDQIVARLKQAATAPEEGGEVENNPANPQAVKNRGGNGMTVGR